MTERTNGIGEIVAILALCTVIMIGIIAVIAHMNPPTIVKAEEAHATPSGASSN